MRKRFKSGKWLFERERGRRRRHQRTQSHQKGSRVTRTHPAVTTHYDGGTRQYTHFSCHRLHASMRPVTFAEATVISSSATREKRKALSSAAMVSHVGSHRHSSATFCFVRLPSGDFHHAQSHPVTFDIYFVFGTPLALDCTRNQHAGTCYCIGTVSNFFFLVHAFLRDHNCITTNRISHGLLFCCILVITKMEPSQSHLQEK